VLTLDQAAAATSAGAQIPPTESLLTDDASVSMHVAHPDIKVLASPHQVSGQDALLDRAAAANDYLTNAAAGNSAAG
jgi:hypothetical protein